MLHMNNKVLLKISLDTARLTSTVHLVLFPDPNTAFNCLHYLPVTVLQVTDSWAGRGNKHTFWLRPQLQGRDILLHSESQCRSEHDICGWFSLPSIDLQPSPPPLLHQTEAKEGYNYYTRDLL